MLGDAFAAGTVTIAHADLTARTVNSSRLAAARRDQELLARDAVEMDADRFTPVPRPLESAGRPTELTIPQARAWRPSPPARAGAHREPNRFREALAGTC